MSYEVVLRYDYGEPHEYVFARTRRLRGAIAERDQMVASTVENMTDHAGPDGYVEGEVVGDAVTIRIVSPHKRVAKTVLVRERVQA